MLKLAWISLLAGAIVTSQQAFAGAFWQAIVFGVLLVAAVILGYFAQRKSIQDFRADKLATQEELRQLRKKMDKLQAENLELKQINLSLQEKNHELDESLKNALEYMANLEVQITRLRDGSQPLD